MEEELLTPAKTAKILGIHLDSARRLLRNGKLPGVKVGHGWRIPRSRLQDMLDGKTPTMTSGAQPAMVEDAKRAAEVISRGTRQKKDSRVRKKPAAVRKPAVAEGSAQRKR